MIKVSPSSWDVKMKWMVKSCQVEYIMLLNLPIILSSNSFLSYLLYPFLFFFTLIYSPHRSTIKQLTITNYMHCDKAATCATKILGMLKRTFVNRLEYIMLLNLPIILSSNSFFFYYS